MLVGLRWEKNCLVFCFQMIIVLVMFGNTVRIQKDQTSTYNVSLLLITNQLLYQLSYKGITKNLIYIAELNRKIFFGSFFVPVLFVLWGFFWVLFVREYKENTKSSYISLSNTFLYSCNSYNLLLIYLTPKKVREYE